MVWSVVDSVAAFLKIFSFKYIFYYSVAETSAVDTVTFIINVRNWIYRCTPEANWMPCKCTAVSWTTINLRSVANRYWNCSCCCGWEIKVAFRCIFQFFISQLSGYYSSIFSLQVRLTRGIIKLFTFIYLLVGQQQLKFMDIVLSLRLNFLKFFWSCFRIAQIFL